MKLILLTFGVVGLLTFFLFSFAHKSFASTITLSDQEQEINPVGIVHGTLNPMHKSERFLNLSSPWQAMGHSYGAQVDQTLQDQKQTTQEPDERIEEPDQEQEPSDQEEEIIEEEEEEAVEIADPLYVWNKGMYYFNDKFYFWLVKPVSQGYSAVVPEDMRISVSNFFYNITTPIRFVSSLLQLKMKSAGNELLRFAVNTTFGVAGLGDFAKDKMDIKRHDEDLGQTFGHYGIGHGFYIVWPILGPSSLRDTVGFVGDLFLRPVTYVKPLEASYGIFAYDVVNDTSLHIGDYEDIIKAAIDPYISIRDAYAQNRKKKVEE